MSRPRSAADVHKVNSTNTQRQVSQGSRSSTPSSGRSTPLFKKVLSFDKQKTIIWLVARRWYC